MRLSLFPLKHHLHPQLHLALERISYLGFISQSSRNYDEFISAFPLHCTPTITNTSVAVQG